MPVEIEVVKNYYVNNEIPKDIIQEKVVIEKVFQQTVDIEKEIE